MGRKLNCWEYKLCGREKGGLMVNTLGECPVTSAMQYDGVNDGIAAGRVCWVVRNSGNRLACPGIGLRSSCHQCEFYRRVMHEEEELARFRFCSALS